MFHRVTDASKVALAAAVEQLPVDGLFDVQWVTPHLASLGVIGISAREYQLRLRHALTLPLPATFSTA
jgi:leucyl/phenylalanyl-tRNA---protein transferase